jgi:pyruvate carboxylase subunit B
MKYAVRVAGRTFEVEVDGDVVSLDGRRFRATLVPAALGPLRRLVTDGRSRTIALTRLEGGWTVQGSSGSWEVEVLDDRARTLREAGSSRPRHAAGVVRAPMPGLVLRVRVEEGQAVSSGAGLVVLEAMKMENEIRAPAGGVVRRVLVVPGAAVEKGAPLIELGDSPG